MSLNSQNTAISGIINHYTSITAIDTCLGRLSVNDTTGFRKGDALLLIQMQGASILTSNNAQFGSIQTLGMAGQYERNEIDSVGSSDIFVKYRFRHNWVAGQFQAVSIPRFSDVVVQDTLRPQPWNGQTGGVVALEVSGVLTLNAPIIANGSGFRGGVAYVAPNNNCTWVVGESGYVYGLGNWRGGTKGEGIAKILPGQELGRGPQANGGGGGNDHNSGGGGGGNASAGGQGGENDEPATFGCDGYFPGLGGRGLNINDHRIYLGGGGGAGHSNNGTGSDGANGGGIVMVRAGRIEGSYAVITANGASATTATGDGAGGGGSGGYIQLGVSSGISNAIVRADGGRGGNTANLNNDRCNGPGGGGAGGQIYTNLTGVGVPQGGAPGIITLSTNGCVGSTSNAAYGSPGMLGSLNVVPQDNNNNLAPVLISAQTPDTVCVGQNALFGIVANTGAWNYQWQINAGNGWTDIPANLMWPGYNADTLVIPNVQLSQTGLKVRCRVIRPGCYEIQSPESALTVLPAPSADFDYILQMDNTVNFVNFSQNALGYAWNFGDGSPISHEAAPVHFFPQDSTYAVTLTVWNGCDSISITKPVAIYFSPEASFISPDTVQSCGPVVVTFENTSSNNAQSFAWQFPGGTPATSSAVHPEITYSASGSYIVTLTASNGVGSSQSQATIEVAVYDAPVAGFTAQLLPGGVLQVNNSSIGATQYTWDFGDGSGFVEAINPQHQYAENGTYVVTLVASNPCGANIIQQTIGITVGTKDLDQISGIQVFPNPVGTWFAVKSSGACLTALTLFDMTGRVVMEHEPEQPLAARLNAGHLPPGMYQLSIRTDVGTTMIRLVKVEGR